MGTQPVTRLRGKSRMMVLGLHRPGQGFTVSSRVSSSPGHRRFLGSRSRDLFEKCRLSFEGQPIGLARSLETKGVTCQTRVREPRCSALRSRRVVFECAQNVLHWL